MKYIIDGEDRLIKVTRMRNKALSATDIADDFFFHERVAPSADGRDTLEWQVSVRRIKSADMTENADSSDAAASRADDTAAAHRTNADTNRAAAAGTEGDVIGIVTETVPRP